MGVWKLKGDGCWTLGIYDMEERRAYDAGPRQEHLQSTRLCPITSMESYDGKSSSSSQAGYNSSTI